MARIQANLRVTNKSCRRSHCIIDTYQLIHQRRFPLVSSLDKTYQQRAKNVPPGSEQIFGDDLPKRILGIKNNKQLFEKEKTLFKPKKLQKVSSKSWKPLPERVPTTPKQQPLQKSPRQSLQTKGKIPKEAQLRVGTINIEEKFNLSQHCAKFIGQKLKKYYKN